MYLQERKSAIILATLLVIPLLGCQSAERSPQPVAVSEPAPEPPPSTSRGPHGMSAGFTFFGDRPDFEEVPFENRLVANLTRHSFTVDGLDFDPDTHDGESLLVFASTRNSERPDIFLKHTDGATLTQLTGDPADDIQPRFSPDAARVAFASNRAGNWDIWMIDRAGTGLAQLASSPADEIAPCWSPDGTRIAFTVWGNRSHQWEIWTLSVDQPGVRHFLVNGMFPAWSPDGGRIAFQRARERGSRLFGIWTVDLEGDEARHPTEIAHSESQACIAPRWSPDGTMLVYCAVRRDQQPVAAGRDTPAEADLWVVETETGLRLKLTDGADASFNPVWAGSGRIFFVSPRAGTENIWSLMTELGEYAVGASDTSRITRAGDDVSSEIADD